MTTVVDYRKFAEECLRWAEKAKTAEEKKAFLDMAQTWVVAGVFQELSRRVMAESKATTE